MTGMAEGNAKCITNAKVLVSLLTDAVLIQLVSGLLYLHHCVSKSWILWYFL